MRIFSHQPFPAHLVLSTESQKEEQEGAELVKASGIGINQETSFRKRETMGRGYQILLCITFISRGRGFCSSRLGKENLLHHLSDFNHGTFSEHISQCESESSPHLSTYYHIFFSGLKHELFIFIRNINQGNEGFQRTNNPS